MDNRYDVTGAGLLELGDIEAVLRPFQADFAGLGAALALELTVDRSGTVTHCSALVPPALDNARRAFCEHALASARFVKNRLLYLDYTSATYRLTVRYQSDRARAGSRAFYTSTGFPFQGMAVTFGLSDTPPEEERRSMSAVQLAGLEYPLAAMREGLEGGVEVLVTFNQAGRVEMCRPIRSSNTARLAYETCYEVRRVARLINPSDRRQFAFSTMWVLAE